MRPTHRERRLVETGDGGLGALQRRLGLGELLLGLSLDSRRSGGSSRRLLGNLGRAVLLDLGLGALL